MASFKTLLTTLSLLSASLTDLGGYNRNIFASAMNIQGKQISTFHGFVPNPSSRARLCQLFVNKNCGSIIYEPQSVEGPKGFPHSSFSPPDGKIASANNRRFGALDEYGINRWVHVEFPQVNCLNETHMYFNLSWQFTAVHSTDVINVYVSNEKYTSNEPLSRRHLDLNPICSMKFHGDLPPSKLTMPCSITFEKYRQLSQYEELLLLSVWTINDTGSAFYQVVDLKKLSESSFKNTWNKCRR